MVVNKGAGGAGGRAAKRFEKGSRCGMAKVRAEGCDAAAVREE